MRYFLDTEFIELRDSITLISIGIKCEDGSSLHLLSNEYDSSQASDWVVDNVLKPYFESEVSAEDKKRLTYLDFHLEYGVSRSYIKESILGFIKDEPEFWAYYSAYDWVVFCWIFGTMMELPKGFPMFCNDLKPLFDASGKEKFPEPEGEHNALVDAVWNMDLYNYIKKD